jgi:hypothetical protein
MTESTMTKVLAQAEAQKKAGAKHMAQYMIGDSSDSEDQSPIPAKRAAIARA